MGLRGSDRPWASCLPPWSSQVKQPLNGSLFGIFLKRLFLKAHISPPQLALPSWNQGSSLPSHF